MPNMNERQAIPVITENCQSARCNEHRDPHRASHIAVSSPTGMEPSTSILVCYERAQELAAFPDTWTVSHMSTQPTRGDEMRAAQDVESHIRAFDYARATGADLAVWADNAPVIEYALRLWASANNLHIESERLNRCTVLKVSPNPQSITCRIAVLVLS